LFDANTLRQINYRAIQSNGYTWQVETLFRAKELGIKIKEMPIVFYDRKMGRSKLGTNEVVQFLFFILKATFQRIKKSIFKR
ncbi:MAG: hypothetical protein ACFFCS_22760, partial [Candidatus Hodarchaeota archaeon]